MRAVDTIWKALYPPQARTRRFEGGILTHDIAHTRRISRYRIVAELGVGGMGTVYRAYDPRHRRTVAIKVLHPHLAQDSEYVKLFRREVRIVRALNSPHVVKVFDFGNDRGADYLVMEYVKGTTLAELMKRTELSTERTISVALHVARALEAAHEEGIVHRDIKPQNILVADDGVAKVADFGVARMAGGRSFTSESMLMGTPEYMSPDHAAGRVDIRSDIYSLGIVVYEMLVGNVPFTGDTPLEVLHQHETVAPPALQNLGKAVPDRLGSLVSRCLAKQPRRRPQTPLHVIAELEALDGRRADPGYATPTRKKGRRRRRKRREAHGSTDSPLLIGALAISSVIVVGIVLAAAADNPAIAVVFGAAAAVVLAGMLVSRAFVSHSVWRLQTLGGQSIPLRVGTNGVGRSRGNRVSLKSPHTSRYHAMIHVGRAGVTLEDRSSGNGTFVNGREISTATLSDGDEVSFSNETFVVCRATPE